jgi:hypothetical protein
MLIVIHADCHSCWLSFMLSAKHSCWVSVMLSILHAECHSCWVSLMLSVIDAVCHWCWVYSFWVLLILSVANKAIMRSVLMLNVVMLDAVAPTKPPKSFSRSKLGEVCLISSVMKIFYVRFLHVRLPLLKPTCTHSAKSFEYHILFFGKAGRCLEWRESGKTVLYQLIIIIIILNTYIIIKLFIQRKNENHPSWNWEWNSHHICFENFSE